MALLKIARMGHPVLRKTAQEVADPTAPEIGRLIVDMIETMADAPGVGLAAPQVHASLRLVMFHVPAARADAGAAAGSPGGPVPLTVLINPRIEPLSDELVAGYEACLSLPDLTGLVPRFRRIRYVGLAPDGTAIDREADGFHARVVQHECDHLDGILYPQRMPDLTTFGFVEDVQRAVRAADAGTR